MKRRTVLSTVAAASAAGVAGCLSRGDDGSDDSDGDSNSDATDGDSGSDVTNDSGNVTNGGSGGCSDPCETPAIGEQSIETTSTTCDGQDTSEASARVDDHDVVVQGTLSASTPCHDAVLTDASIENGQLRVTVDVTPRDGVCAQCIAEISYRATIGVTNVDAIDGVQVRHVGGQEHSCELD
ncbi:hypothetical protein L593_01670 [Salinarchaeum sp. Harcht-Bsk1]|uniref:hypothetical protein n=1 Tax=Salinarchaeum sp. Harcht-Bsk1 TaxID=1333523 RepID=UPI000342417C|nr:hypothetical protein [Salinarchaeum sp. Harcht-Bsk1]AGN00287.1 hypothetical protein L593_01670 [Salinarchaeum sp. Harcht-Bsk1]